MWKVVLLPYLFERMIGFSVTVNSHVVIVSYEGIHILNLDNASIQVQHDLAYPEGGKLFDTSSNTLEYQDQDYQMLGLYGGTPRLTSAFGEGLVLRQREETFLVVDERGKIAFRHKYQDLSGDWAFITFTSDDKFIILGVPYELYIFRRE